MTRWIEFEKISNARELGGIKTVNNKKIKHGMLYRTARLTNMSDFDYSKIEKMNIGLILDYRHYDEAMENPTPDLKGITIQQVPAMKGKTGVTDKDFKKMIDTLDFTAFRVSLIESYKEMPFDNPAYRVMFDYLKTLPNQALLHHCTVGRDRTGVGTALILLLLGVSKESIIDDYLLSNEGLVEMQMALIKDDKDDLSPEKIEALLDALNVKAYYLQTALDAIDEKYDSLADYFEIEYGLTPEIRKTIQEHYLVDTI